MLVQVLAAAVFFLVLFSLFRFAMGLRWAKLSREAGRASLEESGQKVVAELPLPSGEVVFLVEDEEAFAWGTTRVAKASLIGARLRMNGGVLAEHAREGKRLPPPEPPEEYEGGERWDVALYGMDGWVASIPCGVLREGVSREVAATVFEAVRGAIA
jgi:hypothetical protein